MFYGNSRPAVKTQRQEPLLYISHNCMMYIVLCSPEFLIACAYQIGLPS